MLLISHIALALASLLYTTYVWIRPATARFYVSGALTALTLASGTVLVVTTRSPLVSSCLAGLVYLALILTGSVAAWRKLAAEQS